MNKTINEIANKLTRELFEAHEADGTFNGIEKAFQWLLRDYCVVKKNDVIEMHNKAKSLMDDFRTSNGGGYREYKGKKELLECFFGSQIRKEDENE